MNYGIGFVLWHMKPPDPAAGFVEKLQKWIAKLGKQHY